MSVMTVTVESNSDDCPTIVRIVNGNGEQFEFVDREAAQARAVSAEHRGYDRGFANGLMSKKATWHVTHADGCAEDIVLKHGDFVQDSTGSSGQVLFQ